MVICAVLSACAAKPPPPAPAPTPPVAQLDGTYRGTSTRFQADSHACPHPGLVTLYVQNGQFSYRWEHEVWVDSSIDPDGTVHGQAERITLAGKRDGEKIEGDLTNGECGLHFTVTRRES
jgi:hypothetical protein